MPFERKVAHATAGSPGGGGYIRDGQLEHIVRRRGLFELFVEVPRRLLVQLLQLGVRLVLQRLGHMPQDAVDLRRRRRQRH